MTKYFLLITLAFLNASTLFAQTMGETVSFRDFIYSTGKIYVVVICLLLIFAGIVSYIVITDKKIKKLEQQLQNRNK